MSEDRFKQARRSLIDRHNQRQQDQGQGQEDEDTFGDEFEDEATALVNLDARQRPQFAPPPNFEEEPDDDATEMISIDQNIGSPPPQGGVQMRTHSGVQPSYDNFREEQQQQQQWDQGGQQHQQQQWDQGGQQHPQQQQQQWDQGAQQHQPHWDQAGQQHPQQQQQQWDQGAQQHQQQWDQGAQQHPQQQQQQWDQGAQQHQQQWDQGAQPHQQQWDQGGQQQQQHWDQGQQQGYEPPPTDTGHDIGRADAPANQSLVIGDGSEAEFDGNTQFVNLNDFAAGKSFTPDTTAAGYEGSTQFVDLNALQAGAAAEAQPPAIENDPVLLQSYQFGPESIQEGEFTLIFAQNATGRPVVLKRIWEGDPNKMPMPVRQRVAALDQIRHPQLIALNGMIASESGAWVELNRPPGYRLTDIIQQNGPQEKDTVIEWMKQVADVLDAVHHQNFVYANLTPDAIWVQDDGSILLEPFDILAFERRGNLGAFGPPEMDFPPEQRQLYPATDIFSLAAVTVSAMSGLPLDLSRVQEFDKKLSGSLIDALQENPQDRPQTAEEFVASLDSSGGGGLDMKFIIIAVAVIGFAALGTVYYMQHGGFGALLGGSGSGTKEASTAPKNVAATKTDTPQDDSKTMAADTSSGGTAQQEADSEAVDAVGDDPPVQQDPRLSVNTSLRINPVPSDEETQQATVDPEKAAVVRAEAREILDGVEKLVPDQQREKYSEAMAKLATAIRLSGGEPTEADKKLMEDLFSRSDVQEIQKDYFKRVNENLRDKKLSRVKSIYPKLAAVDASANEFTFFNENKTVGIKRLERSESSSTDDQENEDSEE